MPHIFVFRFVALVQAYKAFEMQCSIPEGPVNYISSANTLGILDILWSGLLTIIACSWTIQHLNVPDQRGGRDPGWRGDIKWRLKGTWSTAKWMLTTLIAPEIVLGKALSDVAAAKITLKELQKFAKENGCQWSLTHSMFANMGGLVIRWGVGKQATEPKQIDARTKTESDSTQPRQQEEFLEDISSTGDQDSQYLNPPNGLVDTQSLERESGQVIEMNKIEAEIFATPATAPAYHNPVFLNTSIIFKLRKANLLPRLPCITVEEINDRSKTDSFLRLIAIVQIIWTIVQIITRGVKRLPISQLEVTVVAFAVCAIVIYALNWSKPKGVLVPYTLLQYPAEVPPKIRLLHGYPWVPPEEGGPAPWAG